MDTSFFSADTSYGSVINCNNSYDYSYSYSYDASLDAGTKAIRALSLIGLTLVTIVGVTGNSLVLLSLCVGTRKLGITSILLGSLSFSDLIINIWYVPMELKFILNPPWNLGSFLCFFTGFVGYFAQSSSACMLLVISCERFLVILYPLVSRTMLTRRRTFILVGIVWFTSSALATFPALYKRVELFPCSEDVWLCKNNYTETQRIFFYFYALIILYLLPLGGMGVANTCVMRALIKSSRYTQKLQSIKSVEKGVKYSTASTNGNVALSDQPIYKNGVSADGKSGGEGMTNSETDDDPFPPVQKVKRTKPVKKGQTTVQQRQRVVVMLLAVVLLYAICWLPHFIYGMLLVLLKIPHNIIPMMIFEAVVKILYSSNSALNPIVYGFMSKNFRQRIIHGLTRLKFWNRRRGRSNSLGSAYTLSTRGSNMSQSTRHTRYSALPRA